jgi:hypothetical protein
MRNDSTSPLSASGEGQQAVAPEGESEAAAWEREFQQFVHGRVALTQTGAQSWLAVMTTLLGLFSAVVVVNGSTAISELPVGPVGRVLVFGFAVLVYGLTFIAVIYGALATFGGLGLGLPGPPLPNTLNRLSPGPLRPVGKKLWEWWTPTPMAHWLPILSGETYRIHQLPLADRLRRYLRRSRLLGIAAALLAGGLALMVLGIGAFVHPVQAPASVVVVQGGQVMCGSIKVDANGQTLVGGRVISRATQVVVVAHC